MTRPAIERPLPIARPTHCFIAVSRNEVSTLRAHSFELARIAAHRQLSHR